ncbi:MAG: ion transporter [Nannocystis sp.]|nr:potassium channel family protein [Nannocystis sp.]MBA3547240.1 ion transporter [Nannocystis sp.]
MPDEQDIEDGEDALSAERGGLLRQLEDWLETPMIVLGLIWLALLVVELIWGLPPLLERCTTLIWVLFIVDFVIRFALAPRKLVYLRRNWLTAISLTLPALRLFRIFRAARVLRAARATRGLRLVRVISSVNRGMRALGASMSRRGLGYVIALAFVVLMAGSAGMYGFERHPDGSGINTFADSLWWTAMLMTTMGSEYWPRTPEGRLLCLLLSAFSIAILGYITASLATFFIGRDAESPEGEIAGERALAGVQAELAALRAELRELRLGRGPPGVVMAGRRRRSTPRRET